MKNWKGLPESNEAGLTPLGELFRTPLFWYLVRHRNTAMEAIPMKKTTRILEGKPVKKNPDVLNELTPIGTTILNIEINGPTDVVLGSLSNGWVYTPKTCIEPAEFRQWRVVNKVPRLPGFPYARRYDKKCECGQDLCKIGSVRVTFLYPGGSEETGTQLNADGWLMEPEHENTRLIRPIEAGLQQSAACAKCGEYIEAVETAE